MDPRLLQACQLSWSSERRLTVADGDCEQVLARKASDLLGMPLHEALGIPEIRAQALDLRARTENAGVEFIPAQIRTETTVLRVALTIKNEAPTCAVVDAYAFLNGAPPLQISRLASSLSHEIRNPLSSVKMAVQTLARNSGLTERDQRRLTIANREIRTMERMLGLLSEYGREVPLHTEAVPLRALLQDALSLIELELNERKISVVFDEPSDLPRVKVDTHRLRLVLAQLLLNIGMGLTEGGTLTAVLRPGPDGGATVMVRDEAAAVVPEERATLFEPFGSRLARGAGLSLAALKRVMQVQGGDVSAEPLADQGALFTLTFPGT